MNRHTALIYAMSTTEPIWPVAGYKFDLRLSAFVAAMHEQERAYDRVGLSEWWSARCQLGALLGREVPEASFDAMIQCGKKGDLKRADAGDFCDDRYRPTREKVTEAMRKVKLLVLGYTTPVPEAGTHQSTITFPKETT